MNKLSVGAGWILLSCCSASEAATPLTGSVAIRVLRDGIAQAGVVVTLEGASSRRERETDDRGVARFPGVETGSHTVQVSGVERELFVPLEPVAVAIELSAPSGDTVTFGRSHLASAVLSRLPHAGTVSSVLETLEPVVVTDRIDVAGIESAIDPLWSARGSSWTQNRVLLDGVDVTEPSGGGALFYPDVLFFQNVSLATSARSSDAAGPGAELQLVTRAPPSSFTGSVQLRYTGKALQSENLGERLLGLSVEPREMLRFPSARLELGAVPFYAAANGFRLETGIPNFEGVGEASLFGVTGKWMEERWSLLGMAQRVGRPTFGARPGVAPSATVDATETFQIAQASLRVEEVDLRLGFARGDFESSSYSAGSAGSAGSPVRDLATGRVSGAPPRVVDRERNRVSVLGSRDFVLASHLVRAGVELSRASERVGERVPLDLERLTVDGVPHSVNAYSGPVERNVSASRVALHAQDAFFFDFLDRPWRLSPGVRLDWSGSSSIRWTSLSTNVALGAQVRPSVEIHFSAGIYPHALTTRPLAHSRALTWERRRWFDSDEDFEVSAGELGGVVRRGGGNFTSVDDNLPRPRTDEITVGVEKRFSRGFLRFSGYQRWERNLLQTRNVGVRPESYVTFPFLDVGIDGILGTGDDVRIPVFDQKSELGEDLFVLGHPDGLSSFAQGVDLLLGFERGRFSFRLSGRAFRDVGSAGVGNEATENDTGLFGGLFGDPNESTNAEGRLYFDRAFTGKLALTARGPGEVFIGTSIRYWDGQPFARHLFFEDLGQGFVTVQAFRRGRLRYAFNMTVDLRVQRELSAGPFRVDFAVDVFNLFNQALHTAEVVRSGETFRDPTLAQPARTIVLEGRVRF